MNFITTGAYSERAMATPAALLQHCQHDLSQEPYAFLSARELRGLVAGMAD